MTLSNKNKIMKLLIYCNYLCWAIALILDLITDFWAETALKINNAHLVT